MSGSGEKEAKEGSNAGVISVPNVEFLADVDSFMALPENDNNTQQVLKKLEETYSSLKMSEANNATTKRRLKTQLTEFEGGLAMIAELKRRRDGKEDMTTRFRLADHVFAMAKVPPSDKIGLWLGANVMLEYTLDEGEALLKSKLEKADKSLETTNLLLDTIRENITTLEVNMARVFNWDVKRRQLEKEKAKIGSSSS